MPGGFGTCKGSKSGALLTRVAMGSEPRPKVQALPPSGTELLDTLQDLDHSETMANNPVFFAEIGTHNTNDVVEARTPSSMRQLSLVSPKKIGGVRALECHLFCIHPESWSPDLRLSC